MPACVSMVLNHAAIAARIPHHGNMCLLDAVLDWSETAISCRAISHTDPSNPLRAAGRLGAANGIEYAAQAMAVHGSLLSQASDKPRQGYLTSVRSVQLHISRLDNLLGEISIKAERLAGDSSHILYQFSLSHAGRYLLEGRAAVILDAAAVNPK